MGFTKTSDDQVQCSCGRYYNVGDYCNWCGKPVEKPAEEPEMVPAEMAAGDQAPAPVEAYPQEDVPEEEQPEEAEEPVAAEAPPVEQPIATPPPTEGRRSRRER